MFYIFGGLGIVWAIFWGLWFQSEPKDMPGIDGKELAHIELGREVKIPKNNLQVFLKIIKTPNVWALLSMYHCFPCVPSLYIRN